MVKWSRQGEQEDWWNPSILEAIQDAFCATQRISCEPQKLPGRGGEVFRYISQVVKPKYSLDATLWSKAVSDIDSLALTPIHHWGNATSFFPNKRQ